jgi:hypothetical protein
MNITVLRPTHTVHKGTYLMSTIRLAKKLEAATTGVYPSWPKHIFLAQAQSLTENRELRHSVAASIVEVERMG